MKFQMGQEVWKATHDVEECRVTCPDCGGKGVIRVVMADDSIHSIECSNCKHGIYPPTGYVKYYAREPKVALVRIVGISLRNGKITYELDDFHSAEEPTLSETYEGALEIAQGLAAEHNAAELKRVSTKEKDTRSWSWNASYHRKQIKEAEKQIAYHTSKLNVAALKTKTTAE